MGEAVQERRTVGRYSLLNKIATGGMGAVHLAKLDSMQGVEKLFAIKLLLPQFAEDQSVVDMFITEARIASRITHPNVCQVFELGLEQDELFICMEYLRGIPATSILKTHKPLNPVATDIAIAIVQQTCAGLQFAHDLKDEDGAPLGVVHRDISPGNIFITTAGTVKVLDFGVVKAKDSSYKTRTGALKGKFGYMSPEQIMAEPLDHRSDIFSLGVCLFELLTNRRLFTRESEYATLKAITESPIPKLVSLRPDLPDALSEVLAKALARSADDRYSSMREFSEALGEVMKSSGGAASPTSISDYIEGKFTYQLSQLDKMLAEVRAAPVFNPESSKAAPALVKPSSARADDASSETASSSETAASPGGRSIALALALGVVGLGVIALAVVLLLNKQDSAPPVQAGIVYEGQLRQEGAQDAAIKATTNEPEPEALSGIPESSDASANNDAVAKAVLPKEEKQHRCEAKPSIEERNRCYVSQSGKKLERCLTDHAVEISGTPQISLSFDLNKRGKVMAVEVAPANAASSALGSCVKGVANKIRFGPQEEAIRFRIPLKINQR